MKRETSFTVIELLVVIAIIGLVVSFAFVVVKNTREKARITGLLQFSFSIEHAFLIDIVGKWEFEDTPADTSGNNLNSNWIGSAGYLPNDASPQLGKAGQFSGDNYIQVIDPGDNSILDINNEITIEAWIKINEFGSKPWLCVVCKEDAYFLRIRRDGRASFSLCDETGVCHDNYPTQEVFKFETRRWYHYVGTWDGSKIKILVDGKERGEPVSFSGRIITNNRDPLIGKDIIGIVDGVRLYQKSFASVKNGFFLGLLKIIGRFF